MNLKYKKYISWILCIIAVIAYFEIKHISKPKDSTETNSVTSTEQQGKETDKEKTGTGSTASSGTETSGENKAKKLDITMVDTIPNTIGNTIGNVANAGLAARQGKWMYYTYYGVTYHSPIYRAMLDGETSIKPLNEPGSYTSINVVGDWIYYYDNGRRGIFKMKTDGSEGTQVINTYAYRVIVIGDWIYYSSPNTGIHKVKTDGTGEALVVNDPFIYGSIAISGNKICYSSMGGGQTALYSINIDGSDKKRIVSTPEGLFIINDDWIYYANSSHQAGLYKIKMDGSSNTKISNTYIGVFNISGNKIYYVASEDRKNIYSMSLDGTNKRKLTNNPNNETPYNNKIAIIDSLNIIDDTMFCSALMETTGPIAYKVKTDGSLEKFLN